jgi:peptidoglycan/LPS O-acetylase OafA/YrhL
MMPQYYGNHDFIDGSYWTLLLELKFYFAIAFLLFLQRLIPISLQKISIVLSLPLLYDVFFFNPYSHALSNDILLVVFHNYLGEYGQYFIAGILFYGIYRNSATIYSYTALTICYLVAILRALDSSYESNNPTLIIVHITAFFGIFLAISLKKITNNLFSFLGSYANKILVTLGAATYPLYLLHSKIINMLSTSLIENNLVAWYAVFFVLFELVALVYVVNSFDVYVRSLWKKSFIIQNLLGRIKSPLIKRLFNI